jgi:2-C-methyl-D-erythritol 4-phosphate cytidylyltransferase
MNSHQAKRPKCWAIVPAAGIGSRFGAPLPKQYLELHGKRVLEHSVLHILSLPFIDSVHVCLSATDTYWPQTDLSSHDRIVVIAGGAERAHSVMNAIDAISQHAQEDDWVLVHDAARPCVKVADIERLYQAVVASDCGGILATPVADTVKRVNQQHIERTVDRSGLWLAQTPQIFPVGLLRRCLSSALANGVLVTDEASALEHYGFQPIVVQGSSDNLKITRPEDLPMAEAILSWQC